MEDTNEKEADNIALVTTPVHNTSQEKMSLSLDVTWVVGGPQGSGVESGASIFSHVCAKMGYQIFGKREFYSNIKGEHSYFAVRVTNKKTHSSTSGIDLLVAFDAETIFRHYDDVLPGGGIIYDSELTDISADRVHTLDRPFRERLYDALGSDGTSTPTVSSALDDAKKKRGVCLYPVSFRTLLDTISQKTENPKLRGLLRMYNIVSVSLSLGLLGVPTNSLLESVDKVFRGKPAVAKMIKQVASHTHAHALSELSEFRYTLPGIPKRPGTMLIQGFQGTALGKIVCGCRFQPYYPITPATDESVYLESNAILDVDGDRSGFTSVIQTEDEICAMGMAIGGALTGTRSATCTSGPGFALMTEALGWAGINEVPVVITEYQRSGPSTGLPTRHGQDDLLFAVFAGHGDFPKIVYASGNVEESFYDTARCFNYAEVFQVPLIHMMDKFIANSVVTCPRFEPKRVVISRGKLLERVPENYRRFEYTADGISPRSRLGLDDGIFWSTGDESDEEGHISEDPVTRIKMMDKRMSRLDMILKRIPPGEQAVSYGDGDISEHVIITWGSAVGPALDAIEMLKDEGIHIGLIQIKLLHPFPVGRIKSLLGDAPKVIIDVEANHSGQMGKLFGQGMEGRYTINHYILKYSGRPMTCTEVYDSLHRILAGNAQRREVLTYGV